MLMVTKLICTAEKSFKDENIMWDKYNACISYKLK